MDIPDTPWDSLEFFLSRMENNEGVEVWRKKRVFGELQITSYEIICKRDSHISGAIYYEKGGKIRDMYYDRKDNSTILEMKEMLHKPDPNLI